MIEPREKYAGCVIAIDGTFSSGKGTLGKALAAHYGLDYLDTGKLYRIIAHNILKENADPDNADHCTKIAKNLTSEAISKLIDNPVLKSGNVGAAASRVAVHPDLREALLVFQRRFAATGAVLDGRDIGTVICPHADVKLYIDADPSERAKRRHAELVGYGEDITYEAVLAQLRERDARDKSRSVAPLKPASDAHFIDTTQQSIDQVLKAAIAITDAVLTAS